ncbi:DUF1127 domain-containing protein [Ochrobactrum sp. Marseille-Q0166]|uniref:DUF1127 domain-containing protein n=1 Tax=Ochrobactrum sp. Marseille-Q0166 TaxID=2761105 RepID=UPI0016566AF1|nr:DUF1127 domain-containing protein [Ochrobactrum sp. Marseille-Q0166]MBC8718403.1 DUF1127 domain-containing protein [Ochrobactrum sp. Marseille-Q0166]
MTAISKTIMTHLPATSTLTSVLKQMVKSVFMSVMRRWTLIRNRRHVLHLNELDNYLLKDIGLQSGDVFTAIHKRSAEDPTRVLAALADARSRVEATRHIC